MTCDPDLVIDVLSDLQHDLGKYLRLPLAWLPGDADDTDVLAAAQTALLTTQRGPSGTRSAAQIWADACAEIPDFIRQPAATELCEAVDRALAWAPLLTLGLDRAALTEDLNAVGPAITALISTLEP